MKDIILCILLIIMDTVINFKNFIDFYLNGYNPLYDCIPESMLNRLNNNNNNNDLNTLINNSFYYKGKHEVPKHVFNDLRNTYGNFGDWWKKDANGIDELSIPEKYKELMKLYIKKKPWIFWTYGEIDELPIDEVNKAYIKNRIIIEWGIVLFGVSATLIIASYMVDAYCGTNTSQVTHSTGFRSLIQAKAASSSRPNSQPAVIYLPYKK